MRKDIFLHMDLSGAHSIEANAGTGKTYTIALLVVRALISDPIRPDSPALVPRNLLVTTFTRNAANELKERIRNFLMTTVQLIEEGYTETTPADATKKNCLRLLQNAGWKDPAGFARIKKRAIQALASLDDACISTIHGFCQQVLTDQSLYTGSPVNITLDENDDWLARIVRDYWREEASSQLFDPVAYDKVLAVAELLAKMNPDTDEIPLFDTQSKETAEDRYKEFCVLLEGEKKWWHEHKEEIRPAFNAKNFNKKAFVKHEPLLDDPALFLRSVVHGSLPGRTDPKIPYWTKPVLAHSIKQDKPDPQALKQTNLFVTKYENLIEKAKLVDRLRWLPLLSKIKEAQASRRNSGVLGYDDLTSVLREALCSKDEAKNKRLAASIKDRYRIAIVDEFQDTSPSQFEIFRSIYLRENEDQSLFVIVGDPKQSIYRFRHADIHSYQKAKQIIQSLYGDKHVYPLQTNYRSSAKLVQVINKLYEHHVQKKDSPQQLKSLLSPEFTRDLKESESPGLCGGLIYGQYSQQGPDAPVCVQTDQELSPLTLFLNPEEHPQQKKGYRPIGSDHGRLAESVADEMTLLLKEGAILWEDKAARRIRNEDFLVLCTSNERGGLIQDALSRRGIATARAGNGKVWECEEAEHVQVLLAAMINPQIKNVRRALATPLFEQSFSDLCKIDSESEAKQIQYFREASILWHNGRLLDALDNLFESLPKAEKSTWKMLLQREGGKRKVANLRHVLELLLDDQSRLNLDPDTLYHRLVRYRTGELSRGESEEQRLEDDGDVVRIMTVHKAKGLQAPILILFDFHVVNEGFAFPARLPAQSTCRFTEGPGEGVQKNTILPAKSFADEQQQLAAGKEFDAEHNRLLYVALTRASAHTMLFWPERKNDKNISLSRVLGNPFQKDELWQKIQEQTGSHLSIRNWLPEPKEAKPEEKKKGDGKELEVHSWMNQSAWPAWTRSVQTVTSYSRLAPAYDGHYSTPQSNTKEWNCFRRHNSTGNLFHKLFEQSMLDGGTQSSVESAANEQVEYYRQAFAQGVSEQQAIEAATVIVDDWMDRELDGIASLRTMAGSSVFFPELKFYLALPDHFNAIRALHDEISQSVEERIMGEWNKEYWSLVLDDLSREIHRIPTAHSKPKFDIRGYLTGSIDLLYFDEGQKRFCVVDYKTNSLPDYGPKTLQNAMREHFYLMQSLLYALAVFRFSEKSGVAGGAVDVRYPFLRAESGKGVFRLQWPGGLLERLNQRFDWHTPVSGGANHV